MSGFLCNVFPGLPWCEQPEPEPPPPDPDPPTNDDWRLELLAYHNQYRGPQKLAFDQLLNNCAQDYAQWMSDHNNLTHNGQGGLGSRVNRAGYDWWSCGENIARGYTDAASVFNGWWNSPGHKSNIVDSRWSDVGFGWEPKKNYWCAVFGEPASAGGRSMRVVGMGGRVVLPPPLYSVIDPQLNAG